MTPELLQGMTAAALKAMLKELGVSGYSKWNKTRLVEEILARSDNADPAGVEPEEQQSPEAGPDVEVQAPSASRADAVDLGHLMERLDQIQSLFSGMPTRSPTTAESELRQRLDILEVRVEAARPQIDLSPLEEKLDAIVAGLERLYKDMRNMRPPPGKAAAAARPPPPQPSATERPSAVEKEPPVTAASVAGSLEETEVPHAPVNAIAELEEEDPLPPIDWEKLDVFWMWLLQTITKLDDGFSERFPIWQVRAEMEDDSMKDGFDLWLLQLERVGRIRMETHASPNSIPEHQREGSIIDDKRGLIYSIGMSFGP